MSLTQREWIGWGLTVASVAFGVAATVSAVPNGWSWTAFYGAMAPACGTLAAAWAKFGPAPAAK